MPGYLARTAFTVDCAQRLSGITHATLIFTSRGALNGLGYWFRSTPALGAISVHVPVVIS